MFVMRVMRQIQNLYLQSFFFLLIWAYANQTQSDVYCADP